MNHIAAYTAVLEHNYKTRFIAVIRSAGPNTNGSQFFLCTKKTAFLNGKHCVFGQVISGYSVVKAIESVGSDSGATDMEVLIAKCGQIQ